MSHNRSHTHRTGRRRGMTSFLAMLFLVIFGTVALGFFASTTTTAQISANDERVSRAQLAAESGMDFIRRHLGMVRIPTVTGPQDALEELHADLAELLNETANLSGGNIGWDGTTISLPTIDLGDGSAFAATIALDDPDADADLIVTVTGTASGIARRAVSMLFTMRPRSGTIFDYGVVTRGTLTMDSNARIGGITDPQRGKVLITSMADPALDLRGNASISGQVSLVNSADTVVKSYNSSIHGTTNPSAAAATSADVKLQVEEPDFPEVDTSVFAPYATNELTQVGGKYDTTNLKNIRIRANTNPTFDSNITVEGVIYIEAPNQVTFSSNVVVRGVIAVENDPAGDPSTNRITFNSNVKLEGLNKLPDSADFPPQLRSMAGALILAPNFQVHVNSNFGAAGGHMVASQFRFDSNARGQIDGSVLNLDGTNMLMNSNADLAFGDPLTTNPAGLRFSGHFVPDVSTYTEAR